MEQEETKTTAAAGVEMPPEAESWVQLHESELTELMQKQAKAAITELKRQEKQERKKEKYHNTFTLMKCYRDMAFHIENAISDGQQLELKGMTDEQQRTYLESIRRTRFKTLIMTAHIDKAVEEISVTLCWDNLEALCQDCHNKEHHKQERHKRYQFDENGGILPPYQKNN